MREVDRDSQTQARNKPPRLVRFDAGNQTHAIDILRVREIVRMPASAQHDNRTISIRGLELPLIDLRDAQDVASDKTIAEQRIIVVETPTRAAGLIVDRVHELRPIDLDGADPTALLDLDATLNARSTTDLRALRTPHASGPALPTTAEEQRHRAA